jgi:integral membrane protein
VMAYVTGVLLIVLTVAFVAKLLDVDGASTVTTVVGFAHGWLYVVYLVLAFDLCSKAKWPFGRMAWVLLAGTIPTAAFFVERRVTRELAPKVVGADAAEPVKA